MRRRRLLWLIYPAYLLVVIVSITAVTWYGSNSFKRFSLRQTASDLELRVRLVQDRIGKLLRSGDTLAIPSVCSEQASLSAVRLTLVAPTGRVICDSEEDPAQMANHADRPEIIQALTTGRGEAIRYSYTLHENMMYVALPIAEAGKTVAVLRAAVPITAIEEQLSSVYTRVVVGGLGITLAAALIGFFISRKITRRLDEMRRGAERFAQGRLEHRLPVSAVSEIGGLAEALNQMAAQLQERLQAIIRQRNEREAVLASMVEGVIALDSDEKVMGLNRAASELLNVSPEFAAGRTLHEIVRNPAMLDFVARVLAAKESQESEIVLYDRGARYLQAHGTVLRDADEEGIGALIVLNDVTGVRRLESVRRDFVANVSHELRTPITSIKGFVETLRNGEVHSPEDTERFLGIIARQTDRLNSLIADLLTLSELEQTERGNIGLEFTLLKSVLQGAIAVCGPKASVKDIQIRLQCEDNLKANINGPLLEQAVVNLIDNAIKYSEAKSSIEMTAKSEDAAIAISVTDHGCGIEKAHLPRLFERFYRVDRARSRELGGTGLGLSIVRHIVLAQGGRVSVESVPGKGSTFTIFLPSDKKSISA